MSFLRKLLDRPRLGSLLLCALVLGAVLTLWRYGRMQYLELEIYDQTLRWRSESTKTNSRVVIVGITDEDIHNLDYGGWPLKDTRLAELLKILSDHQPRVMGVDIYRDMPVPYPPEQQQAEDFHDFLAGHTNIVWIYSLDTDIPPPPALVQSPDRIGFNDLPADSLVKKVVRRGLLSMSNGSDEVPSFGFQVARVYLQTLRIGPQPVTESTNYLQLGKAVFRPFAPNDCAYVKADAGGFQFILDYKGPRQFPTFSLSNVFSRQLSPEAIRDKVVLIGTTATSVKDYVSTPLQSDHEGVEVLAQVVDQLLRAALEGDEPIRSWTEWAEAVWIVGWGLLGAVVAFSIRPPFYLSLALGAGLLLLGAAYLLLFRSGWWIPVAAPAAAFLPSAGLVTAYLSRQEEVQRGVLMQLFARHVSKDIAEALWEQKDLFLDGNRPRSQKLTATILFTDLKGFSAIAEKTEPTNLFEWLNQYMERMARVVIQHGGVLRQFAGDGVMAIFGIPVARTTQEELSRDAVNAVRCALGMGRELTRLNESWQKAGLPTVNMRAGIFTGPLAAGTLGSAERLEYTVIGDSVNTASRLESFDKATALGVPRDPTCRILVGEPTWQLLGDRFEAKSIGAIHVKGKAEAVTVYQVFSEKTETKGPV